MDEWQTVGKSFPLTNRVPDGEEELGNSSVLGKIRFSVSRTTSNNVSENSKSKSMFLFGRRKQLNASKMEKAFSFVAQETKLKAALQQSTHEESHRNTCPRKHQSFFNESSSPCEKSICVSSPKKNICSSLETISRTLESKQIPIPNALWRYDTHYVYHVPLLEKPAKERLKMKKYSKKIGCRNFRQFNSLLPKLNNVVVCPSKIAQARRFCNENPTLSFAWLSLSQLESEAHVTGLTEKERLNRRLFLLKEGLEVCPDRKDLVLEFFKILERRDPCEFVQSYYIGILQLNPIQIEDTEVHEAIVQVIRQGRSSEYMPDILKQFLDFLCHSSNFSCSYFLEQLSELLPKVVVNKYCPTRYFDKTAEAIKLEKQQHQRICGTIGLNFALIALRLLASASQWKAVAGLVKGLGQVNMLNTLEATFDDFSKVVSNVLEQWERKIPGLGELKATKLYLALLDANTPHMLNHFAALTNTTLSKTTQYHNILLDELLDIKNLYCQRVKEKDSSHTLNWFDYEKLGDQFVEQFFGSEFSDDLIPLAYPRASHSSLHDIHDSHKIFLITDATSGCLSDEARHRLFDILGNPFALVRHGSSHPAYTSSLTDTQLDLLILLFDGFQVRHAQHTLSEDPEMEKAFSLISNEHALMFFEAFGFSLGGSSLCDVHFFNHVAQLFVERFNHMQTTENNLSSYQLSVRKRFSLYDFDLACACNFLSTQMLAWCVQDTLLFSCVIGYLCYTQKSELAQRLLMLMDTSLECWACFVLYNFLACPTLKRFHETRLVSQRITTAMNLFPGNYAFLSVLLRLECLGLLEYQRQHCHPELSSNFPCAPCILHLLCCAAEGTLEECNDAVIADDENSVVSFHPWQTEHIPSRIRLLRALKNYEAFVNNGLEHDPKISKSHSALPYILTSSWFAALLAMLLLSSFCDDQIDAWNSFQKYISHLELNVKQSQEINETQKISLAQLEALLDILLLCIMASCPTLTASYIVWNFSVIQDILRFTLDVFPHHHRAAWLATQIFRTRAHLVKLRCFLDPARISLKALVISELATGFPSYRRLERAFENALDVTHHKRDEKVWDLYLHWLYLAKHFGWSFFTGLPKDDGEELNNALTLKLSTVSQRACFNCPYSKKIWLHRFYVLDDLARVNDIDSEKFLEQVESLYSKEVHCYLDPLSLLTSF